MTRFCLTAAMWVGLVWMVGAGAQTLGPVEHSRLVYKDEGSDRTILVYQPRTPGPKQLVMFVPGTQAPSVVNDPLAVAYLTALSDRGFVVAAVDYNNSFFARFSCSVLDGKVRAIFDRSNPESAINAIYANTTADPKLGLGVIGFSQGSWIVHQSIRYTGNVPVKAALLMGTGTAVKLNFPWFTISLPCNKHQAKGIPKVLAINGDADSVYTYADSGMSRREQLRRQLAQVTGKSCGGRGLSCIDPADGSGWMLVPSDDVSRGRADHNFETLGRGGNLDPAWFLSKKPWGLDGTVSWMESAMRGRLAAARSAPSSSPVSKPGCKSSPR